MSNEKASQFSGFKTHSHNAFCFFIFAFGNITAKGHGC